MDEQLTDYLSIYPKVDIQFLLHFGKVYTYNLPQSLFHTAIKTTVICLLKCCEAIYRKLKCSINLSVEFRTETACSSAVSYTHLTLPTILRV